MSTLQTFRRHRKPLGGALAALMAVWQIGQPLQAADHTWTAGTTTDFNWDDAGNWSGGVPTIAGTGTAILPFIIPNPGSLSNPSVLTLGATSEAYLLNFKNNYTLSGGQLALGAGGLYAETGVDATISSPVTGAAGLTKNGGGSVRLANGSNGYTGTTSIRNGSLIISSGTALGGSGNVSILTQNAVPSNATVSGFNGGALVLDGTAGGFDFARNIDFEGFGVGGRGAAIVGLGDISLSGTLTSAISPLSPTTFRASRVNSVNGTMTLSGTVNVNGTTLAAGTNAGTSTTVLTLGGANSAGVANFDLTGTLTGASTLEKTGAGTLFLRPTNASGFQGQIRVSATVGSGLQSSVRVTQTLAGTGSVFGASTKTEDASSIDLNGGILEFRSSSNMDFNALAGGKNVHLRASSTVFTGPAAGGAAVNGLTTLGAFRVVQGTTLTTRSRNGFGLTLQAWTQETANGNSTITNEMGGTLTFNGGIWNNSDGSARTLTFSGNGNTRIVGDIQATGTNKAVTKQGTGVLTLNGVAGSYTGATSVQAGTLQITDFRSIGGTAPINLGLGATGGNLIVGGLGTGTPTAAGLTTSKPISFPVSTGQSSIYANQTGANPVILNGTITSTATTGNINLGGSNTTDNIITTALPLSGTSSGLTKVGAGTWVLSAANLYQGATNIQAGTLKLRASTGGTSNVIPETATNTIVFSEQGTAQTAGGTLEFGTLAATGSATETLGSLIPTAGAATVRLLGLTGSAASLTFTSLGATTAASSVNFITSSGSGGVITLTGAASATATTLPGTANFQGHLYHNGADFADVTAGVVGSPVYVTGTAGNFQNAGAGLVTGFHNRLTTATATGAATVSSLVTNSQTLTLSGNLVVSTGGLLQSGGTGSILSNDGTSRLIAGGAGATNIAIRVNNPTDVLNLGSATNPVNIASTSSGGLTKNGAGRLNVFGINAQTGTTTINEGTIALSGTSARLSATTAGLVVRQGATLSLGAGVTNANAVVSTVNGAGTISGTAGVTFTQNGGGTWNGVYAGTGFNVTKTGGAATWSGLSTYTGTTTIGSTGLVTVDTLAIGGTASGIGASTNAAANLVLGGTTTAAGIDYRGNIIDNALTLGSRSASTDRLFTLVGTAGATLSSTVTNNNAIAWTSTGAIVNNTTANATLIFGGSSTGDNTFLPQLTNSSVGGVILAVTKNGAGQWNLGAANNLYTGVSTINEGILGLNDNGALSATSPLLLAPTSATSVAILQMSGTFDRNLAATATAGTGSVTFGGSTASTTGGVGFAAHSTPLLVAIGGTAAPTPLTWGSGGFVGTGTGQNLALNSTTALSVVDIRNDIALGATARTINVLDNVNTGADYAIMSGVLTGTGGTAGGLVKIGAGVLELTGANSYAGTTQVQAGTLVVSSLGNSATPGSTSVGDSTLGNTNDGAIVLGNATTTGGSLQYVGAGETSDRKIRLRGTTAGSIIYADGSGPLVLTNVAHDTVETGNKTLSLRGSNMGGNAITGLLTNNGTGVLSVTVDGNATWILSNPLNSYTGNTSVNGGALGVGDNEALGDGTLVLGNGNIFAYGGDRAPTNAVSQTSNTTTGFIGDYSLTLGNVTYLSGDQPWNTNNNIVSGKTLTFGNWNINSLTGDRTWTIDGSGETVVGDLTTTAGTARGVNLTKAGNGTLVLAGSGGSVSNFNQNNRTIDLDRGVIRLGANEVIGHGLDSQGTPVVYGGLTLTPELATGDIATFDLNGKTETINALTATTDGESIIDNSSASPATLIFGEGGTTVAFGTGGVGTYSITQTGGGAINLTKTGTGNANFTAAGTGRTLGNTGTVTANGGVLNINSASVATGAVGDGGAVNFKGGFTTPANLLSVTTNNGGLVSFANGSGTPFTSLTSLSLSTTGNSGLELDVGDTGIDTLTTLNAATVGNVTTLFIKDVDITSGGIYNLLVDANGGLGLLGNYLLNLPGYTGSSLSVTPNLVQLTAGTLVTSDVFWNNGTGQGGGTLTQAWSTVDGTTTNINFSGAVDGLTALQTSENLPGKGQKVIFQADNLSGGAALNTTLGQSFTINALEFRPSAVAADTSSTITIAPGTVSSNSLTLKPSTSSGGINLQSGAAGTVTISAPLVAGANQTWTVESAETELLAVTSSSGSATLTVSSTAGLTPGMSLTGAGIPANATIVSMTPTTITLSGTATATSTAASTLAYQNLNVTGALSGSGNITKAGNGIVTINGTNAALLGTYTNSAGKTIVNQLSGLGGQVGINGSGTDITVSGGAFLYNNATGGTFVNDITLNGGTLSAGGGNHTYSGGINVAANSTINMRDLATSTTFGTTSRNITLSGVVVGTSAINVDSVTTAGGGNQLTGNLVFNNAASTWNGALSMTRGGVFFQNVAGNGNATPYFGYDGLINFNQFGRVTYRNIDGQTLNRTSAINFAAGAVGELSIDNVDTLLATNYVVNQQGAVNLNAGSIARFTLDDGSALNLTGGVVLNGNASFSVQGSAQADNLVTISGTGISGTGNLAINDEAGTWSVTSRTLRIDAAGSYLGDTTLNEGTLILGHQDALSSGSLTITGGSTIQAGITLTGTASVDNVLNLGATLTTSGTNSLEFSGNVTNSVDANRTLTNNIASPALLTLSGAALNLAPVTGTAAYTLTLSGTGSTTISAAINDGSSFANGLTVTSSGTTTLTGPNTYNGLTTMNQPTGVLLLQGSNTGTGGTTLTAGTLQLDSASNGGLASGTLTLTAGTVTAVSTARSLSNNTLLTAVTLTGTENLTFNGNFTNNGGNRTLTNNITSPAVATLAGNVYLSEGGSGRTLTIGGSGNTNITGPVTNSSTGAGSAGVLAKGGLGTLTLSSTGNAYTGGTTINLGTVRTAASNVIPDTGTVTVNATTAGTALLDLDGNSDTIAALTLGGVGGTAGSVNQVTTGAGTLTLGGTLTTVATGNPTTAPTISGNLNLGTANRTIAVANSTGSVVDLSIQAVVSGTGFGFTKTGAGVLELSNTNTYEGTTTLLAATGNTTNGVIAATANNALGTGPVALSFNAGAVTAQLTLSGGITLGNSAFTTTGAGSDGTTDGIIRSVSGSNIISGNLNLTGGGGSSTYRADTGASLTVSGTVGGVGSNLTRIVTLVGGGDFVFNGTIRDSNDGTISTVGVSSGNTGTTTLNGTNTYTLATTVGAGSTLIAGSTQAFGINSAATVTGTLRLAGNSNSLGSIAGAGTIENASATGATLTVGGNNTSTAFSGVIQDGSGAGALALTKTGTGTTTFSGGLNTYTGITTLTGGTLSIGADADLGTAPVSLVANQLTINGGTLATSATFDLAATRGVTLSSTSGGFAPAAATTLGISGEITGSGSFTKAGAGTVELKGTAANTYTGLTTVSAGTLDLNKTGVNAIAGNVGAGGLDKVHDILVSGGTLRLLGNDQIIDSASINVTSGTLNFNNFNETIHNLDVSGGTVNFGTGDITIEDPTWSGGIVNVAGNTTVGTQVQTANYSAGVNEYNVASTGTLTIGTVSTAGPFEFGGSNNNAQMDVAGTVQLRAGSPVELRFTGTGTSTGSIIGAGQFNLNGSTRTFNIGDAGSAVDMNIGVVISNSTGTAGILKTGAGTLQLTNANTFNGGMTVSNGTLLVNNTSGSATGTGSVTVNTGATLGGSGIIAPTVTNASVSVQGLLNVGNAGDSTGAGLGIDMSGATGTLVVDLTGGVHLDYFSGQNTGVLNPGLSFNDQLAIVGGGATLNLGGDLTFNNFNGLAANTFTVGSSWKLFAWSGLTTTGSFSNITGTIGNFSGFTDLSAELLGWDFSRLYDFGEVSIVLIPEPSRAMLLLLGLLGLGFRRRRSGV